MRHTIRHGLQKPCERCHPSIFASQIDCAAIQKLHACTVIPLRFSKPGRRIYHCSNDSLPARRWYKVHGSQQFLKRQDRNITSDPSTRDPLPNVQIRILTGRARNRIREVRNTAYFIGTNRDCDMVLGDDRFPAVYAFLLICREGVIIRHLGQGPRLQVDGAAVRRAVVTGESRVSAGPFDFAVCVQAGTPLAAERLRVHVGDSPRREQRSGDLIEEASRLLSVIDDEQSQRSSIRRLAIMPNGAPAIASSLGVSVGVPVPHRDPPVWHHRIR
jgi:hypothetical protein